MLLLHISIALASVGYATYVFFSPSKSKLYASYGLLAATIASGTVLIISNPAHLLEACMMGLLYVSGISIILTFVHRKLAKEVLPNRRHNR